jgi:RpiB/LacA/LacB family sugar-phosphate isomerase
MLYIASDHGGFNLKEEIKQHLGEGSIIYEDLGPASFDAGDDYPDFAKLVTEKVSVNPENDLGILICRSGQGVNIVANKFKNIRATLVWNEKEAVASKRDDLSNVLSIPSDYVTSDEAKKVVDVWLATPMGTEDRHLRRVNKINEIENNNFK